MRTRMKKLDIVLASVLILGLIAVAAIARDSTYDSVTDGSDATVTFGANPHGMTVVKSVDAKSDETGSAVKIYGRTDKEFPISTATNGATVIAISNAGTTWTNADIVVYQHVDGSIDQTTVASATTSNVTLTAAISSAGATGDALYKLEQDYEIPVGVGTAAKEGDIYYSPVDSPVHIVLGSGTNGTLSATVER